MQVSQVVYHHGNVDNYELLVNVGQVTELGDEHDCEIVKIVRTHHNRVYLHANNGDVFITLTINTTEVLDTELSYNINGDYQEQDINNLKESERTMIDNIIGLARGLFYDTILPNYHEVLAYVELIYAKLKTE